MLYADDGISFLNLRFENDVKVDGTQTIPYDEIDVMPRYVQYS